MKRKRSGGLRKHGRDIEKCRRYREKKTRERNKLKRVLQSSGEKAATEYAKKHTLDRLLRSLIAKKR